jgi:hypothetical protein
MSFVKFSPYFLFAFAIDGFQLLIDLAVSRIATLPGTVGGCAIGAQLGGKLGCLILGAFGSIPVINGGLAILTEPIGIAVGFAIGVCISMIFGSMLVLFLELAGVLDRKAATAVYIGEALPGVGAFPAWTGLVIRCALKESKKKLLATAKKKTPPVIAFAEQQAERNSPGIPKTPVQPTISTSAPANDNTSTENPASRIPMQDMRVIPAAATTTRPTPVNNNSLGKIQYAKAA